jgi:flagellar hook-length control protein FliK
LVLAAFKIFVPYPKALPSNSETLGKEQRVLDMSLTPQATLFNLLPTMPQQGTENLYYNVGASTRTASQIETADAPHVESFEQMLERIRTMERIRKVPEASVAEREASPETGTADDASADTIEDGAELSGHVDKNDGKKGLAAVKQDAAEKPKAEAKEADTEKHTGEDTLAGMLGMARPPVAQSGTKDPDEKPLGTASAMNKEEVATGGTEAVPAVDAEYTLSLEDGVTLTDTYPLFENKPDVQNRGFEPLVDDASAPDLAKEAEVWLADGKNAAGTAKQKGETKDDLKSADVFSDEREIPESLRTAPDVDYQLASFTRADAEKGAKAELAADKKKADAKKLNIEVRDMRSASASAVHVFAEADTTKSAPIPVTDMSLDLKGDLLASIGSGSGGGDSRQTQTGFEQFRSTDMKSAAQLESFLSRELHNGLNGDIVRQASVMLRDGGEGLIRLQLHPESLGNVRIKLTMSGNRVEGVITVESPEALNAFERELESLEMAFRDSGFEGASLNMQMSGGKNGDDFDGVQAGAFSQVLAASSYDSSANVQDGESRSIYEHGNLSILA